MSDALDRLKNRSRPSVPNRDSTLAPGALGIEVPRNQDTSVSKTIRDMKTKQSTMRIEAGLSERLQDLCRQNRISRETLIEAMFEYCEINTDALEEVIASAKNKAEYRKMIANSRRTQSMVERFG